MNSQPQMPTLTDLMATTAKTLTDGGYRSFDKGFADWNTPSSRLFEDEYNVVGVAIFSTCDELVRTWSDLQGSLVDLISLKIGSAEGKAWDGYLVLLTPGIAPSESAGIEEIRYDTTRLRKLVATGGDLTDAGDVERLLRPLLPLRRSLAAVSRGSALDLLPTLLAQEQIEESITKLLVEAFAEQRSLMDALHKREEQV